VSSGGLGHRWPTPNSWTRDEGEEEEEEYGMYKRLTVLNNS